MSPQIFLEANQEHLDKDTYSSRLKFKDKGRKAGEGTFYSTTCTHSQKEQLQLSSGKKCREEISDTVFFKMSRSSPQMNTTHASACVLLTDEYDEMKLISSH